MRISLRILDSLIEKFSANCGMVERMLRKIAILLCLVALCCGIGKGIHLARIGFSLRRIAAPVQTKLVIWNSEADLALDQPFRYLGRGRQCFAFSSLDGKYVLKFPRTDIYQIPLWMRTLPVPLTFRESYRAEKLAREKFVLTSMKIAYEDLKEDTGIMGLHFGKTPDLGKSITLIDALGYPYHLPAHSATFILQTKQPILMKAFLEALHSGDLTLGKQILDAFIDVVVARGSKGIWNKDESFLRNYGFDGKKGYQIDIGSFYRKADGPASIRDTMHPVRTWLAKTDSEMLSYFDSALEKRMDSIFQSGQ
jgi:hypothetical protein